MRVSIIIPAFNEESCLASTLAQLHRHRPHEVIVVDGGSTDATCLAATRGGTLSLLITAPRGRAAQMNAGAAHATGDAFLFLHADCTLEPGALDALERCLRRPRVVAGCFHMNVSAPGWAFRAIDAAATARVRLTGLAYGDQGLFLTRETFERIGGFPAVGFMEDVLIGKALRRLGRIVVAPSRIFVSPRRWQKMGLLRQTLRNWALTALAAAGVPTNRLATYYAPIRDERELRANH